MSKITTNSSTDQTIPTLFDLGTVDKTKVELGFDKCPVLGHPAVAINQFLAKTKPFSSFLSLKPKLGSA